MVTYLTATWTNFDQILTPIPLDWTVDKRGHFRLGCANKDLWALCAPIFIIVVYCKTATSYFLGRKITGTSPTNLQ